MTAAHIFSVFVEYFCAKVVGTTSSEGCVGVSLSGRVMRVQIGRQVSIRMVPARRRRG